jgi:hypothetical protein
MALNVVYPNAANATSKHKSFVQNCGITSYQPKLIWIACGDGGEGISGIKWIFWGKNSAAGKGTYYVNNCVPYCWNGKVFKKRVQVFLTVPKDRNGKNFLTKLEIRSPNGNIPLSDSDFLYESMY